MATAPRQVLRPSYAPLQSPATTSQSSSASQSYGSITSPASAAPLSSPAATTQRVPTQQQPQMPPMQRYRSFEYQPDREGAGRTAAETQTYLNQAALLAEAAKRAQMAVMMRDLDSMEL